MTNPLYDHLRCLGFEPEVMGGGNVSLSFYLTNGTQILATGTDGAGMPDPYDWMLGVYGTIGDTMTDALWLRFSAGEHARAHKWKRHIREALACAEAVDRLRWFDKEEALPKMMPPRVPISPEPLDGRRMVPGDLYSLHTGEPIYQDWVNKAQAWVAMLYPSSPPPPTVEERLAELTREFTAWLDLEGLPHRCALDLLAGEPSPSQRIWLNAFSARWEAIEQEASA